MRSDSRKSTYFKPLLGRFARLTGDLTITGRFDLSVKDCCQKKILRAVESCDARYGGDLHSLEPDI